MQTLEAVKQLKEPISRSKTSSAMQEVEFTLYAPDANKVCIAGQFNDWNTKSMPMKKSKDGKWRVKMNIPKGKYEYKYFVDGMGTDIWRRHVSKSVRYKLLRTHCSIGLKLLIFFIEFIINRTS